MRKLCARGNTLIRKFKFCTPEVKRSLFKTYCYSLYCSALWVNYRKSSFNRLKVNYNNVMRRLEGVPLISSASHLFATCRVKTLPELMRTIMYSLMERLLNSSNVYIVKLLNSNVILKSRIWETWRELLFV